jgi:hypothetical protein
MPRVLSRRTPSDCVFLLDYASPVTALQTSLTRAGDQRVVVRLPRYPDDRLNAGRADQEPAAIVKPFPRRHDHFG